MKIIITKEDFEIQDATLSEIIASLCAGFAHILTMPEIKEKPELRAFVAHKIMVGVELALHLGLQDGGSKTPEKFESVDMRILEKLAKKMKEEEGGE